MDLSRDAAWAKEALDLSVFAVGDQLILKGRLPFKAHYDGIKLRLGRDIPSVVMPDKVITDDWPITLQHTYSYPFSPPIIYDASHRIEKNAKKYGKTLLDMHLNQGGIMPLHSFCVCRIQDLCKVYEQEFRLEDYAANYLIPFLFQQVHFEKFGSWPWLNYAHGARGDKGYFEY